MFQTQLLGIFFHYPPFLNLAKQQILSMCVQLKKEDVKAFPKSG